MAYCGIKLGALGLSRAQDISNIAYASSLPDTINARAPWTPEHTALELVEEVQVTLDQISHTIYLHTELPDCSTRTLWELTSQNAKKILMASFYIARADEYWEGARVEKLILMWALAGA